MTAIGSSRRALTTFIALVLPLAFLASGGSEARGATQEATVVDVVVWAFPHSQRLGAGSGNCIDIGHGTLNVAVSLGRGSGVGPIEFHFFGFDGRDSGSRIDAIVGRDESSWSLPLSGGVYCYSVANGVSIDETAPPALLIGYGQGVNLRMTLSQ